MDRANNNGLPGLLYNNDLRVLAMLWDAPQEPPIMRVNPLQETTESAYPQKQRSYFTISKSRKEDPIIRNLMEKSLTAMRMANPADRQEFVARYLNDHINSQNFPKGHGLPASWGRC